MRLLRRRPEEITTPTLQARANVHWEPSEELWCLCAVDCSGERGLVVLEMTSGEAVAKLAETFVTREERGRGLGTEILRAVENFVRDKGKNQIVLEAEPLDDDEDDGGDAKIKLIQWYLDNGFRQVRYDELEKMLT
jgi:GNAT superfamily N-acetyltransferase